MMKKIPIIFALALFMTSAAQAQNITGDWIGTLKSGAASVHLVLHITKGNGGGLNIKTDCIEQALADLPTSSVGLTGSRLVFAVVAVKGFYDGKVDPGGAAIRGTWSQAGQQLPLEFRRATVARQTDIDGIWTGTLDLGQSKFRLVLHIARAGHGYACTMDSLDQGTTGIPATTLTREGLALTLGFKSLEATYDGKIDKNMMTIEGKWSQLGVITPLEFKHSKYVM
ncbi:MAG: hypothetical protein ACRD4K_02905 [Candidatus Acidiferrales bacterium]